MIKAPPAAHAARRLSGAPALHRAANNAKPRSTFEGRTQTLTAAQAPATAAHPIHSSRERHAAKIAATLHAVTSTSLIGCRPMKMYVAQIPSERPAPVAIHHEPNS